MKNTILNEVANEVLTATRKYEGAEKTKRATSKFEDRIRFLYADLTDEEAAYVKIAVDFAMDTGAEMIADDVFEQGEFFNGSELMHDFKGDGCTFDSAYDTVQEMLNSVLAELDKLSAIGYIEFDDTVGRYESELGDIDCVGDTVRILLTDVEPTCVRFERDGDLLIVTGEAFRNGDFGRAFERKGVFSILGWDEID